MGDTFFFAFETICGSIRDRGIEGSSTREAHVFSHFYDAFSLVSSAHIVADTVNMAYTGTNRRTAVIKMRHHGRVVSSRGRIRLVARRVHYILICNEGFCAPGPLLT